MKYLRKKDKISDEYRKNIDALINDQSSFNPAESLDQFEENGMWEEISTEIEINEVWRNISSGLDNLAPFYPVNGLIVKSVAIVLIILSGTVPVQKSLLISNTSYPDLFNGIEMNDKVITSEISDNYYDSGTLVKITNDSPIELINSYTVSEIAITSIPEKKNVSDLIPDLPTSVPVGSLNGLFPESELIYSNDLSINDEITAEIPAIPSKLNTGSAINIESLYGSEFRNLRINNNSYIGGYRFASINRGRVSGGLITSFKNTWLLNQETYDGLKSESLRTTKIVFSPDVGVSLNYSFNKSWLLQADAFLYSGTGQRYQEYIYGRYSRKSITLRYSMIAFSVKYRSQVNNGSVIPSSINLFAGGYLSVLHRAYEKINTNVENIASQYRKFDTGIRLGAEYEFQFTTGLSIAPGVFMTLGIPNIYKGDIYIPGYLRRTHNGSAGFQLAFYYHFE
jgi:hypothetical protein